MKTIVVFAAFLAIALATATSRQSRGSVRYTRDIDDDIIILKETPSNNIGLGGYKYGYELSDGQKREETAELVNEGTEYEALRVTGSYSWVDANGQVYTVTYVADENGFQPQGAHLPSL